MQPSRSWSKRDGANDRRFAARAATLITAWLVALLLIGMATGCGIDRPLRITVPPEVERSAGTAVILFVDGVSRDRMCDLAAAGELPNIQTCFIEGGVTVEHAVSSLPSITYPNASTIITGQLPSHHGILGNQWYDPTMGESCEYISWGRYRDVNAHLNVPTLFTVLDDQFTVNVQGHTRAGATVSIENRLGFVLPYVTGHYLDADVGISHGFDDLAAVSRRAGRWPRVIMAYFMGVDEIGHRCGVRSDEYAAALRNIDRIIGRVFEGFGNAGLQDSTCFVLLSDHGMMPFEAGQRLNLADWLREHRQLRICADPGRRVSFRDDAVVMVDGGRVATIHLRDCEDLVPWITKLPALHTLPAVGLVALRDAPGRVVLISGTGRAIVEYDDREEGRVFRISSTEGRLLPSAGYLDIAGDWHDAEQWLAQTAASDVPDLVPQAAQLFDSLRSGHCMVFAAPGWSLTPGCLSGHGSIYAGEMHVPMYFSGPGVPTGVTVSHARLADVMPTVLGLLGESHRLETIEPVDGVNRVGQFFPVMHP